MAGVKPVRIDGRIFRENVGSKRVYSELKVGPFSTFCGSGEERSRLTDSIPR